MRVGKLGYRDVGLAENRSGVLLGTRRCEQKLLTGLPLSLSACSCNPGHAVPPVQRLWRMFQTVQLPKELHPLYHHWHP